MVTRLKQHFQWSLHQQENLVQSKFLSQPIFPMIHRIPTVKLKIPGKVFLKSESRISVTFEIQFLTLATVKKCEKYKKSFSLFFMAANLLSPNSHGCPDRRSGFGPVRGPEFRTNLIWSGPDIHANSCHWQIAQIKNYNLNVAEIWDSDFKNTLPGIVNFTVGILMIQLRHVTL